MDAFSIFFSTFWVTKLRNKASVNVFATDEREIEEKRNPNHDDNLLPPINTLACGMTEKSHGNCHSITITPPKQNMDNMYTYILYIQLSKCQQLK